MWQQNLKMFPSATGDPAAYYFPCFSWRSLYWDFAIWLPQRVKMVRPNPILDHWRMQPFLKLCLSENVTSLSGSCARDKSVIYVCVPGKTNAERNIIWAVLLASLWINVHSVKKINWINTINSPQQCGISLVFSPRHLKSYTVFFFLCFQKINICLCTVLRVVGIWNEWWWWWGFFSGGGVLFEMIDNSDSNDRT